MCLDDVEPFGFSFQVLEWFQRLVLGGVVVTKVESPVFLILIDGGLSCFVALAVTVTEVEIGRVVRHGLAALYVRSPVAEGEVLVADNRLGKVAEGVACGLVFALVEGILEQHVSVERIVFG